MHKIKIFVQMSWGQDKNGQYVLNVSELCCGKFEIWYQSLPVLKVKHTCTYLFYIWGQAHAHTNTLQQFKIKRYMLVSGGTGGHKHVQNSPFCRRCKCSVIALHLIDGMCPPVDGDCITLFKGAVELITKELEGLLLCDALIKLELGAHVLEVGLRLQLRHPRREHHGKRADQQAAVVSQDKIGCVMGGRCLVV